MDKIQLENLDCFEFLRKLEDNSVDLVLIDPPYAISRKTGFNTGGRQVEMLTASE